MLWVINQSVNYKSMRQRACPRSLTSAHLSRIHLSFTLSPSFPPTTTQKTLTSINSSFSNLSAFPHIQPSSTHAPHPSQPSNPHSSLPSIHPPPKHVLHQRHHHHLLNKHDRLKPRRRKQQQRQRQSDRHGAPAAGHEHGRGRRQLGRGDGRGR